MLSFEFHVKCLFSRNVGYIVHTDYTVEKMQSLSMIIFADGRCGLNLWVRKMEYDGKKIDQIMYVNQYRSSYRNLGGKNTAAMKPGERIIISTPGGGGYGPASDQARS